MNKPTQEAQRYFEFASMWLNQIVAASVQGRGDPAMGHMATGLTNMAMGLDHLSVALRATYMKLEEIERLLNQSRR
jgi:hypothetical protein